VALVLSAMSGKTKREGTTSRLLEAADEVLKGNTAAHQEILRLVRDHHVNVAREAISNEEILSVTVTDIEVECDRLGSFLEAAEVYI
jgi:aspartate kinase